MPEVMVKQESMGPGMDLVLDVFETVHVEFLAPIWILVCTHVLVLCFSVLPFAQAAGFKTVTSIAF